MRNENYNSSQLTDSQIRDIFGGIKPSYRIEEAWLDEQRARLEGAIQVAAAGSWWTRFVEQVQLWWAELPFLLGSARPVLVGSAALVIGIFIGRSLLSGPGLALPGGEGSAPIDLAEMIRSGQIKKIDIGVVDDVDNPIVLNLTTGREMQVTGSTDRDDILAALEYVLVRDPNPGQRLRSARILGSASGLESKESTIMALVSALLTDENPGVRLSIVRSLQGVHSPLVKNAFIKTTLEDTNEGVRLASVEALGMFLGDLSVRSALLLASRMDEDESVRYRAYQLLSEARFQSTEEGLDTQP